jgi:hypothetical protein
MADFYVAVKDGWPGVGKPMFSDRPVDAIRTEQKGLLGGTNKPERQGVARDRSASTTSNVKQANRKETQQGTGIFLPPGERLVSGLYLDPEAYEVQTTRAGVGDETYDALTIRPMRDSGEVGAFLLTASGRRYLLHFVVGSVGMLAVTFEGPLVTPARTPAPALVLPRPPP